MCFTVSCQTHAAWRGVGLTRPSKRMTRQCGVQSTVREHPTAAFDLHTARANSARPPSPPTPWTVRPTEPGKPRRSRLYLPSTEKDQINKAPYPPARAPRGPSSLADLVVRSNLLLRSMLLFYPTVSVVCPTGTYPPPRLARRPNRGGHIGEGGAGHPPSCGTCIPGFG